MTIVTSSSNWVSSIFSPLTEFHLLAIKGDVTGAVQNRKPYSKNPLETAIRFPVCFSFSVLV
ncbi:MAG: hypothetical protein HOE30_10515 [Deltaproteobacteria bacterium]|nr:hypothetical protein [Deltaproteobacteria bacterium]